MDTQNNSSNQDAGGVLPQKAIDDLKTIYRRKCGSDLSDHDAREMGNRLLRVFAVLTRDPADRRNRV